MIVGVGKGVGLTNRPYRELGGEEKVTLADAEMPRHSHDITKGLTVVDIPGEYGYFIPDARRGVINNWGVKQGTTTQTSDGDTAHENMPPYIALFFCKKEAS